MESALDVLSRAAATIMVQQDSANEARLTSKELPTTAWRRERRLRTGEYHHPPQQQQQQQHPNHHHHHHHHLASPAGSSASSARGISPCSSPTPVVYGQNSPNSTVTSSATQLHSNAHQISMMMAAAAAAGMRPLCETTGRPSPPPPPPVASHSNMHMARPEPLNEAEIEDAPLDMSVSSSLKQRNSPPPPYREPLPGSQFISTLPRPSVITQAPPKRDTRDSALLANRENDNRSSESIDEHFRRSLGNDYFALFNKKSPSGQTTKTPSPQPSQQPPAAHARTPPPPVTSSTNSALQHSHTGGPSAVVAPPPAYPNVLTPAHQQQSNSVLLSPAAIMAAHMKAGGPTADHMGGTNSPPLPLVVRAPLPQQPLALQRATSVTSQTPLPSPQSPTIKVGSTQSPMSSTAGSRTASPLPLPINQTSSQQSSAITLSRFTSVENSPSSSPGQTAQVVTNVAPPNASPTLPAIMRIKTEPGLQSIKANNPTPPASPTSTTNPNILIVNNNNNSHNTVSSSSSPSSPSPSTASSATIKSNSTTTTGGHSSSAEVLASVDDHFAKALGDTWKRLQESKEMRK
ncbi:mucin-5AC isoform X2 [Musca domestica]|uniref:Mucin-5AC isoform X2 n=1 Tax=Musca domestica TaxID=7370 RepID=A0A1I8N3A0_MUSDO|nr:mucin-5AC isoform X2 [Musca domestica]